MSLHISLLLKAKTQTTLLFLSKTLASSTGSRNTNSTHRVFVGNTTHSGPFDGTHRDIPQPQQGKFSWELRLAPLNSASHLALGFAVPLPCAAALRHCQAAVGSLPAGASGADPLLHRARSTRRSPLNNIRLLPSRQPSQHLPALQSPSCPMAAAPGPPAPRAAKPGKKQRTVKRQTGIYTYQEPPHR